jgi:hypothetical protein
MSFLPFIPVANVEHHDGNVFVLVVELARLVHELRLHLDDENNMRVQCCQGAEISAAKHKRGLEKKIMWGGGPGKSVFVY